MKSLSVYNPTNQIESMPTSDIDRLFEFARDKFSSDLNPKATGDDSAHDYLEGNNSRVVELPEDFSHLAFQAKGPLYLAYYSDRTDDYYDRSTQHLRVCISNRQPDQDPSRPYTEITYQDLHGSKTVSIRSRLNPSGAGSLKDAGPTTNTKRTIDVESVYLIHPSSGELQITEIHCRRTDDTTIETHNKSQGARLVRSLDSDMTRGKLRYSETIVIDDDELANVTRAPISFEITKPSGGLVESINISVGDGPPSTATKSYLDAEHKIQLLVQSSGRGAFEIFKHDPRFSFLLGSNSPSQEVIEAIMAEIDYFYNTATKPEPAFSNGQIADSDTKNPA